MTERDTFGGTEDLGDSLEQRINQGFMEGRTWGDVIAFQKSDGIYLINSDGTNEKKILKGNSSNLKLKGWSLKGDKIYVVQREQTYNSDIYNDVTSTVLTKELSSEGFKRGYTTNAEIEFFEEIEEEKILLVEKNEEENSDDNTNRFLELNTTNGETKTIDIIQEDFFFPRPSPNKDKILYLKKPEYGSKKEIIVIDLEKDMKINLGSKYEFDCWLADDTIMTSDKNQIPYKTNIYTNEKERTEETIQPMIFYQKFSPDKKLFAATYYSHIDIHDSLTAKKKLGIYTDDSSIKHFDWSPKSDELAIVTEDYYPNISKLMITDLDENKRTISKDKEIITEVYWQPKP